jgi:hypothetical protein
MESAADAVTGLRQFASIDHGHEHAQMLEFHI